MAKKLQQFQSVYIAYNVYKDGFNQNYTTRASRRLDQGNLHSKEASFGRVKRIGILGKEDH